MAQLVGVMWTQTQHVCRNTQVHIPLHTRIAPILVPFGTFTRWNKEFKFHLFKFASSKDEVTWRDFVTKTLADLGDAEWWFLATCLQNIREVDEHALSSLRA